jgi:hypothetical protein
MLSKSRFFAALAVSAGLLAAPAAHAEWRHGGWGGHEGWHDHDWRGRGYSWGGPRYYRRGPGIGPIVGGAVLGLGAGALIAGALAPPPVYYPPPRAYYAPPVVYAPPPAYGYAPGYYGGY